MKISLVFVLLMTTKNAPNCFSQKNMFIWRIRSDGSSIIYEKKNKSLLNEAYLNFTWLFFISTCTIIVQHLENYLMNHLLRNVSGIESECTFCNFLESSVLYIRPEHFLSILIYYSYSHLTHDMLSYRGPVFLM